MVNLSVSLSWTSKAVYTFTSQQPYQQPYTHIFSSFTHSLSFFSRIYTPNIIQSSSFAPPWKVLAPFSFPYFATLFLFLLSKKATTVRDYSFNMFSFVQTLSFAPPLTVLFAAVNTRIPLSFLSPNPIFFIRQHYGRYMHRLFMMANPKKKQSKGISNTFYILESCSLNLLDWSCVMCITAAWQHFPIWIRN